MQSQQLISFPKLLIPIVFLFACGQPVQPVKVIQKIPVIQVIQKDVPVFKEFVGQVYGLYDIPIRARVEGYVEGRHFKEGFMVKKGQLLYEIDPQPFEASVAEKAGKVAEAQTKLVYAENDLRRIEPLAEINAVSQSDLDAAVATKGAAEASVDAAKASLRIAKIELSYARIKSPITGLIGSTKARVGEFVGRNPNPVILNTVSQIDTIRVQFFLAEADYLVFARHISEVLDSTESMTRPNESRLELILADGLTHNYKGKIDFVDRDVDPTTGSILVQASFPNPKQLVRPGQYAKVKALIKVQRNGLLVPQRCVQELQGQYQIYVVNDNNVVEAKQVDVGEKLGDLWLINEGLNATDKIIIDGIQKVASGMKVVPELTTFESKSKKQL